MIGSSNQVSPPYQLSSVCERSEDHFLVQNHRIDAETDKVVAYCRTEGKVEGVLLQDGVIRQIYRDPNRPDRWNAYELPGTGDVTDMVAGTFLASNPDGARPGKPVLRICYTTAAEPGRLHIASETDTSPKRFTTATIPWGPGPLRMSVGADHNPLVTALCPSADDRSDDARLYYYCPGAVIAGSGCLTGFSYFPIRTDEAGAWAAVVVGLDRFREPQLLLCLPGPTAADPAAVRILTAELRGEHPAVASEWPADLFGRPGERPSLPAGVRRVRAVESAIVVGGTVAPSLLVRTASDSARQQLWLLAGPASKGRAGSDGWRWTEVTLPAGADVSRFAVLVGGGDAHEIFVLAGTTLSVITRAPAGDTDALPSAYTQAIPLDANVASMTVAPSGNELLLVKTDGTLETLERDPRSRRWSDTVVHVPVDGPGHVSGYRLRLILCDRWNTPVPAHPMQVAASIPVSVMVDGAPALLTPNPTWVRTDGSGQVVLTLPADCLDGTVGLTVMAEGLPGPATLAAGMVTDRSPAPHPRSYR